MTANPGSTFLQTSGAATVTGMLSWRKATGTGNTGWVAEGALADTGWRQVLTTSGGSVTYGAFPNADWAANANAGWIKYRRRGALVTVVMLQIQSQKNGNDSPIQVLPAGFRGSFATSTVSGPIGYGSVATFAVSSVGDLSVWPDVATGVIIGQFSHVEFSFTTSDTWPSSLPGSAA